MPHRKSLDIILGGGKGKRLELLTRDRAKPATPFGGLYRIIDIPFSNLVNSGSTYIIVVVQYQPASLVRHLNHVWNKEMKVKHNLHLEIAKPMYGKEYAGTANAVYQNLDRIIAQTPQIVGIFGGDHIYLIDVSQMKQFHLDNRADLTIAALPVPVEQAKGELGVLVADANNRVVGFEEKVQNPTEIPGMPVYCWGSMGNYVFKTQFLTDTLKADAAKMLLDGNPENRAIVASSMGRYTTGDFGYDIIPGAVEDGRRVMLYDFRQNAPDAVPIREYWRDVGTIDQLAAANFDLVDGKFVLANPGWPIHTFDESHGKSTIGMEFVENSIVANGGVLEDCRVVHCVAGYNVHVGPLTEATDSIFMGDNWIGRNVRINRTILDKGTKVLDNMRVGVFRNEDHNHGFPKSLGGYIVIPRNHTFE